MSKTASELLNKLKPLIYNPAYGVGVLLDDLQDYSDGNDITLLDPNSPFIWSLEASILTALAAIENNEACMLKAYPSMATTYSELYNHMSDDDHLDIFSSPGMASVMMLISYNEFVNKALPLNVVNEVRKLIIPRDTTFFVGDVPFTIQYPIEFRILPHGGLQVIYDTDTTSPITELSTNTLEWQIITTQQDGVSYDFILVTIPVKQYGIKSYTASIIPGTSFKNKYSFDNRFYYARVWLRTENTWKEIGTTYSELVLDPEAPTAKLAIANGSLSVTIPDVYINSGIAVGDVRVDIYTTLGKLTMDLSSYDRTDYSYKFLDLAGKTDSSYYTTLAKFSNIVVFGNSTVTGGKDGIDFETLREQVINNATGARNIPISEAQLESELSSLGFSVEKSIDYVTSRIYHASAEMPDSTISSVSTPVGTTNGIFETSFEQLTARRVVKDNGNRITLTPKLLYRIIGGMVVLDDYGDLPDYLALQPADRINKVGNEIILYSPLHYVLDINDDVFESRPYYLDSPTVSSRAFVATNTTLVLDVGIGDYALAKTDAGWQLVITTRSDEAYKELEDEQCFIQLLFYPRNYETPAYVNGTLAGINEDKERVWVFNIDSNLDIDKNDDVIVTNFRQFTTDPVNIAMQLDAETHVIFGVSNFTTANYKSISSDSVMVAPVTGAKAVTEEILRFNLGTALNNVWSNARNIATTYDYVRATEDIPRTYTKNDIEVKMVNGVLQINLLHAKGDIVYNEDGTIDYLYYKGDTILDPSGEPIIENERAVGRRLELYLFDARYVLCDSEEVATYVDAVVETFLAHAVDSIPSVSGALLERTELYMYPKTTIGYTDVVLADNTVANVNTEQRFKITYYLTETALRNADLRTNISTRTREVLVENLKKTTVSASAILHDLRSAMGDDIVDVEMAGFGEEYDQKLMSVSSSNAKLSLGKELTLDTDGSVTLKDSVTIAFVKHTL